MTENWALYGLSFDIGISCSGLRLMTQYNKMMLSARDFRSTIDPAAGSTAPFAFKAAEMTPFLQNRKLAHEITASRLDH